MEILSFVSKLVGFAAGKNADRSSTVKQKASVRSVLRREIARNPENPDSHSAYASFLLAEGDVWNSFLHLRKSYLLSPTPEKEGRLLELIGTSDNYAAVLQAMDTQFDSKFYLARHPDVSKVTELADVHYLLYGWKEDRQPSRFFDPKFYRSVQGHLFSDRTFPLVHLAEEGRKKGFLGNSVAETIWFEPIAPDDRAWEEVSPAVRTKDTRAVVILPVYKGYDETLASIFHALRSRRGDQYSLLVVNDFGPDQDLNTRLRDLAEKGLFEYRFSDVNKGFVRTINHALVELSGDLDVVLLNSDAYVFPGWFARLIAHAEKNPLAATITPLSNNATLCSYPLIDQDNALALECSAEEMDRLVAEANKGIAVEAPTGVGFCFFMRRAVIERIGVLDEESFLVGYGEENDFCMRALNHGFQNLIACDVFAYHVGSVSFSAIKEENFWKGQSVLEQKHPNYLPLVMGHMDSQATRFARRNIDLARLLAAKKNPVIFITHRWSGGIDTYLKSVMNELEIMGDHYVAVRVHDKHLLTVETVGVSRLFLPNLASIDIRTESDFIVQLLRRLQPKFLHMNSFAGLDWHSHKKMLSNIKNANVPYKYILHDYSAISQFYQLLRPDNLYAGIPTVQDLKRWSVMKDNSGAMDGSEPVERLETYRDFLAGADDIEVPSIAAQQVFTAYFGGLRSTLAPHKDHLPDLPKATRRTSDGKIKVAVIGAIGPHKGSDILLALAKDSKNRNLNIEYLVIGYSNQDEALKEHGVAVTGPYQSETQAIEKLSDLKPDLILIPSIWPETFCYTLSLALKLKMPPVVFDLGAQAERTSALDWAVRVPVDFMKWPSKLSDLIVNLNISNLWERAANSH